MKKMQTDEGRRLSDDERLVIWGLGISGEAGEVSDHIKKFIRDDDYYFTPDRKEGLVSELGDVMWYVSAIASIIGIPLENVAEKNIEKLKKRREEERKDWVTRGETN